MGCLKLTYYDKGTDENFIFTANNAITKSPETNFLYVKDNHLGNVNAVINDRKIWNNTDNLFEASVTMTADYYPFGMLMPGRHFEYAPANADYRYAYNGMEQDNEVSGNGNSYTTEFRQYDPRLGRWKSLDPLMAKYPGTSPYSAFNNNPIYYVDPFGLEGQDNIHIYADDHIEVEKTDDATDNYYFHDSEGNVTTSIEGVAKTGDTGSDLLNGLRASSQRVIQRQNDINQLEQSSSDESVLKSQIESKQAELDRKVEEKIKHNEKTEKQAKAIDEIIELSSKKRWGTPPSEDEKDQYMDQGYFDQGKGEGKSHYLDDPPPAKDHKNTPENNSLIKKTNAHDVYDGKPTGDDSVTYDKETIHYRTKKTQENPDSTIIRRVLKWYKDGKVNDSSETRYRLK